MYRDHIFRAGICRYCVVEDLAALWASALVGQVDERVVQYELVKWEPDVKNEPRERERVVFVDICCFALGVLRVRCAFYGLIQGFGAVTRVHP